MAELGKLGRVSGIGAAQCFVQEFVSPVPRVSRAGEN